jgi:uncharacterized protein (TIGR02611 family)
MHTRSNESVAVALVPSSGNLVEGSSVADRGVERDQSWWRRARSGLARYRPLELTWKALVLLIGGSVLLAGMVMFVTPGPGWLALIAGLAILATEFAWAERLLHGAKRRAQAAADKALDPAARRETLVIGVLVGACVILAALWWIQENGLPASVTDAWAWISGTVGGES